MGFWDRFLKGKVFEGNQVSSMACELTLCGGQYLLSEFDLRYAPNDAQREYIEMYVVIEEPVCQSIESWIMYPERKETGRLKFYKNSDAQYQGALFDISFREASCVRYRKNVRLSQPVTVLVMTMPSICMGGEEFEMKR